MALFHADFSVWLSTQTRISLSTDGQLQHWAERIPGTKQKEWELNSAASVSKEWREWRLCAHTSYLCALRLTVWQISSATETELQTAGLCLVSTFGIIYIYSRSCHGLSSYF